MILMGPFHLTILYDSDTRIQFQLGISVYFLTHQILHSFAYHQVLTESIKPSHNMKYFFLIVAFGPVKVIS